jgi:hypothetical protein
MIGAEEAQHTCDRVAAFVRLDAEPDASRAPRREPNSKTALLQTAVPHHPALLLREH